MSRSGERTDEEDLAVWVLVLKAEKETAPWHERPPGRASVSGWRQARGGSRPSRASVFCPCSLGGLCRSRSQPGPPRLQVVQDASEPSGRRWAGGPCLRSDEAGDPGGHPGRRGPNLPDDGHPSDGWVRREGLVLRRSGLGLAQESCGDLLGQPHPCEGILQLTEDAFQGLCLKLYRTKAPLL